MRTIRAGFVAGLGALVLSLPAMADSLASGAPSTNFTLSEYVGGLTQPTAFAFLPDGRTVITQKGGEVVLRASNGSTSDAGSFDVDTGSEKGLLNVVVHPSFASNRRLIFYYSDANGTNLDRHKVVSVALGTNGQLEMNTLLPIVSGLRGPANHDGGALAIGPDGKLYIGVGDTGCNSGQEPVPTYTPTNFFGTCLTNGNGKILRVNLDGTIPNDNPLVNVSQVTACGSSCGDNPGANLAAPRTDIWAWGFRNPWRFSFDMQTGNLWVGDVGETSYEEVNVIPPGGGKHYGWPWREGNNGHAASTCAGIAPNKGDCVDPVYYCKHGGRPAPVDGGCSSITGGVIVDSCDWPAAFRGRYFFGDNAFYSNHDIYTLELTGNRAGVVAGSRQNFGTASGQPVHLAVGPDGALYWAVIRGAGSSSITRAAPTNPVTCAVPDAGTGGAGGTGGGATGGAAGSSASGGAGGGGTGGTSTGGAGGVTGGAGGSAATGGSPGTGGGGTSGGGTVGSAGKSGTGGSAARSGSSDSGDDGSCGCRAAGSGRGEALLGLLLLTTLYGRRRRRHS